ncbi:GDSL-type esterase/lipase family protein [Nocardioides sp. MH1]|uniref:GDSL-type esterase/lipase family protein n=1 Tax=Nocardioides sp. MH1 TaxID=3242490 RepID=UPI00351F94EE
MNSDKVYSILIPMLRPMVKGRMGAARRRHFEVVGVPPRRVLFIGDSLTEGGLWSDLLPELPTTNRGIGGEGTYDLLERVESAINDPLAVSLLIGTNDLHGPRELRGVEQVAERTEEIIRRIRALAPDALLLVNSLLPRTELFRDRLREINALNEEAAARHGATYVDLWPTFADDAGVIRNDYTRDGLHITPAGYLAWAAVLRPYLAPFAVGEPA